MGNVDGLKIEPPIGSSARKIYLPEGQLFETTENDKVARLKGGGFWSRLAKTERFGWHLIPLAIATPFLAFGLYRTLIPLFISFAMFMTPDGMTRRIPNYKLLFRHSNIIGPNAFALPGGTIVMTDELIEMFPKEDHVISAVLAHEIGAMIGLIAGDAGPMLEDIVLEGSALLSLSFSRKHEMQADDFSYDILSGTGQRADGLIEFFKKLEEEVSIPESGEWMMTHPLSKKRIENIQARIDTDKT